MHDASVPHRIADQHAEEADRAIDLLCSPDLDPIVDMVLVSRDGEYEARSHDGSVRFRRDGDSFEVIETEGADPLARQDPDAFSPLAAERSALHPHRKHNTYPYAYDHTAQLFDAPAAPDICVIHSAAHNWEDQGGHLGEHGSIDVVQARAPFVIGGRGVAKRGIVDESARLVDVAPTMAALLGCEPDADGRYLRREDGAAMHEWIDHSDGRPAHVVGILFDGTNANVLYDMVDRGEAPNVARIVQMGGALRHGAIASLPTVTLANHTTILTGVHPGHHGILHNAWYDRATQSQVITNSAATWPSAMSHLRPGTDSLAAAVGRSFPDAFTALVNEPADEGAMYSTFDLIRNGEPLRLPEISPDEAIPRATDRFVRPSKDYRWSSIVDELAIEQAVGLWSGSVRGNSYPMPQFLWVNFTLTDSAMHEGGPHSEEAAAGVRDSDARLGELMAAIERAGAFDDTAFVLMADHGMEETDRSCTGDWGVALREGGVAVRDEGYGFLYFGTEPPQ